MVRYALEIHENKQYASIHLSVKIPKLPSWLSDKDASQEGKRIKEIIEKINGVEEASSYEQCVRLKRGGAFTFDEIFPKVLEVLKKELSIVEELEEVPAYA